MYIITSHITGLYSLIHTHHSSSTSSKITMTSPSLKVSSSSLSASQSYNALHRRCWPRLSWTIKINSNWQDSFNNVQYLIPYHLQRKHVISYEHKITVIKLQEININMTSQVILIYRKVLKVIRSMFIIHIY